MNVVGYVRVSTEEQAASGAGLDAQRQAISSEVHRRSWILVEIFEDAASGKSLTGRQGLRRALEAIESGQADGLVVAKLDRLSRSVMDFASLMDRSRRREWALVALDLGVDTTTPAGEAMANVMATFAQLERRMIGQRTKEGLAARKNQGVILGRPRVLPPKLRRRIDRLHQNGRSLRSIAEELNAEGVPTAHGGRRWYASTIQSVLRAA